MSALWQAILQQKPALSNTDSLLHFMIGFVDCVRDLTWILFVYRVARHLDTNFDMCCSVHFCDNNFYNQQMMFQRLYTLYRVYIHTLCIYIHSVHAIYF
jgi:hypothetical protein